MVMMPVLAALLFGLTVGDLSITLGQIDTVLVLALDVPPVAQELIELTVASRLNLPSGLVGLLELADHDRTFALKRRRRVEDMAVVKLHPELLEFVVDRLTMDDGKAVCRLLVGRV